MQAVAVRPSADAGFADHVVLMVSRIATGDFSEPKKYFTVGFLGDGESTWEMVFGAEGGVGKFTYENQYENELVDLPGPDEYAFEVDADLKIQSLPHTKHMDVLLSDYNGRVVTGISDGDGISDVFPITKAADLQQAEVQHILASKACVVRLKKKVIT